MQPIGNTRAGHRGDNPPDGSNTAKPTDIHGDPVNDISLLSYSPAVGQNAFPGATLPIFYQPSPLNLAGAFDTFDALWRQECEK